MEGEDISDSDRDIGSSTHANPTVTVGEEVLGVERPQMQSLGSEFSSDKSIDGEEGSNQPPNVSESESLGDCSDTEESTDVDLLKVSAEEYVKKEENLVKVSEGTLKKIGSNINWLQVKVASVFFSTTCCTCIVCVITILIGLMFFLVFHFSESSEYSDKINTKSKEKKDLLNLKLDSLDSAASSVYSFYDGSSFVDYGEYKTYCEGSIDNDLIEYLEWIVILPQLQIDNWNHSFGIGNMKLPTSLQTSLNNTGNNLNPAYDPHFLISYIHPYRDGVDNIAVTNFGDDLATDSDRKAVIDAAISTNSKRYMYLKGDDGKWKLELFVPVIKESNLDLSQYPKSNQNGLIRGIFKLQQLIEETFEDDELTYYFKMNDEFIMSNNDDKSKKSAGDGSLTKVVSKDLSGGPEITIEIEPTNSFRNSPFLPLKWIFFFLPCFFCCFYAMLNCGVCLCCRTFLLTREQNSLIKSVVEAIVVLDFNHPKILQIEKQKSRRSTTTVGLMKKLIKQIRLYRKFLPQTMLSQIEEQQNSETASQASRSSKNSSKKNMVKKDGELQGDTLTNESTVSDTNDGSDFSRRTDNSRTSKTSQGSSSKEAKKELEDKSFLGQFSEREVVVMIVSVDQIEALFVRAMQYRRTHLIRKMYTSLNEVLHSICRIHKGDFHTFSPRGTMFSWGSVRRKIGGEMNACRAAMEIMKHSFFKKNKLTVRISICKGMSYMGNFELREAGIRQFDVIGFPSLYCPLLNRICRKQDCTIVIDAATHKSLKFTAECDVVDYIKFGPNRPQKVYSLVKMNDADESEWFYELEQMKNDKKELFEKIENCWDIFLSGGEEKRLLAEEEMKKIIHDSKMEETGKCFERLGRVMEKSRTSLDAEEKYVHVCEF